MKKTWAIDVDEGVSPHTWDVDVSSDRDMPSHAQRLVAAGAPDR